MSELLPEEAVEATEEKRLQLLERCKDLYYFLKVILGHQDLAPRPHGWLCQQLQGGADWGDWRQGLVCWTRGSLKTTIVRGWILQQGLLRENFACRVVMNSHENAESKYLGYILSLFTASDRADLLRWLFRHRLPPDLAGFNRDGIALLRSDPAAEVFLTVRGLTSRQESYHGDLIVFDDPEGADAERGLAANVESYRAVSSALPLLIDPSRGRILVVCTPWGDNPLAYRLRESEADGSLDNARRAVWKISWLPIVNERGQPTWPERFGEDVIARLRNPVVEDPRIFLSQRMLVRPQKSDNEFDIPGIRAGVWNWVTGEEGTVSYPVSAVAPPSALAAALAGGPGRDHLSGAAQAEIAAYGLEPSRKQAVLRRSIATLRFYAHVDPKHKERARSAPASEPAEAAICVVGVAPDGHALVLETWSKDAGIEETVRNLYRLDRRYGFYRVTVEYVGAQVWFASYVKALETANVAGERAPYYIHPLTKQPVSLPPMSRRLQEAEKGITSKEAIYRERLAPYFSRGLLHVSLRQVELLRQLECAGLEKVRKDLVDALAQGPSVWRPPAAEEGLVSSKVPMGYLEAYEHARGLRGDWRR